MRTVVLCLLVVGALAAPSRKPTFRRGLNRIVGGDDTIPGEFEYQLSLQDITYDEPFHFCGASLYNKHWAISACHCVEYDVPEPGVIQVVSGEYTLYVDDGTEQRSILNKIILHPDFDSQTLENDVSLLRFTEAMVYNDYVNPIGLQEEKDFVGVDCTVSGWGATTEGGEAATILQKVHIPTVSDAECEQDYGAGSIIPSMLCAGFTEGGKDACQGDSGGPLVCNGWLSGIVSWGYGCARPNYPGVYTEVAYFKDWIIDTINSDA